MARSPRGSTAAGSSQLTGHVRGSMQQGGALDAVYLRIIDETLRRSQHLQSAAVLEQLKQKWIDKTRERVAESMATHQHQNRVSAAYNAAAAAGNLPLLERTSEQAAISNITAFNAAVASASGLKVEPSQRLYIPRLEGVMPNIDRMAGCEDVPVRGPPAATSMVLKRDIKIESSAPSGETQISSSLKKNRQIQQPAVEGNAAASASSGIGGLTIKLKGTRSPAKESDDSSSAGVDGCAERTSAMISESVKFDASEGLSENGAENAKGSAEAGDVGGVDGGGEGGEGDDDDGDGWGEWEETAAEGGNEQREEGAADEVRSTPSDEFSSMYWETANFEDGFGVESPVSRTDSATGEDSADPQQYSDIDDVSDLDDEEPTECTDLVVGQFEGVQRPHSRKSAHKGLWRIKLRHGIIQIAGREMLFNSLSGEFNF